jgi:D-3-phosphoglycerate dehydrogenase / 2-oxoglutarate reductase
MAATTSQSHLLRPSLPSLRRPSLPFVSLRGTSSGADRISFSLRAVSKPTVLVAEKLGAAGLELLKEYANVDCSYNMSPEELCAKIALCDALIVRSGTKVRLSR